MYIDSHCHLDFAVFEPSRKALIDSCLDVGVDGFLVPSTTYDSWSRLAELAAHFPQWRIAYGLHPYFLAEAKAEEVNLLGDQCETQGAIAVGEIGLDCWPGAVELNVQQRFFSQQLMVARDLALPVIIHARKSYDLVLKALRQTQFHSGGVIHAFNGSIEQALRFEALGFVLGIGGTITYPRAKKAQRVLAQLSDTSFVLETDSPDMPLCGFQGEVNTPLSIPSIARHIAAIRNTSVEEIALQTNNNLLSIFPKWYKESL